MSSSSFSEHHSTRRGQMTLPALVSLRPSARRFPSATPPITAHRSVRPGGLVRSAATATSPLFRRPPPSPSPSLPVAGRRMAAPAPPVSQTSLPATYQPRPAFRPPPATPLPPPPLSLSQSPCVHVPPQPPPRILSRIVCASVQDRPAWAPLVPLLLQQKQQPQHQTGPSNEPAWTTARLSSHDLAIRLRPQNVPTTPCGADAAVFRFLLMEPDDVGQPATTQRLQRLGRQLEKSRNGSPSSATADTHCAVLFLLAPQGGDGNSGHQVSTTAYEQLQTTIFNLGLDAALALLPVTALAHVPATLAAYCGGRTKSGGTTSAAGATSLRGPAKEQARQLLRVLVAARGHGSGPVDAEVGRLLVAAAATVHNNVLQPHLSCQNALLYGLAHL